MSNVTRAQIENALGDERARYKVVLTRTGNAFQVNLDLTAKSRFPGRDGKFRLTDYEKCELLINAVASLKAAGLPVDETNVSLSHRQGAGYAPWPCVYVATQAATAVESDETLITRIATDLMKGSDGLTVTDAMAKAREAVALLRQSPSAPAEAESETISESTDDLPI